uniref:Sodium/hydrogen exchanger 8 n=1 Tax=Pseudo-nitzschia australis TaxID=44445 RepID=A0A7S4AET3_9STRA|mmetsp:Transcript_13025/g.27384  ORF Transcript_13025/g.27384 Transcript_13025/m.27384 type:complete len:657 (-) Transcript_13025:2360-4330(-)
MSGSSGSSSSSSNNSNGNDEEHTDHTISASFLLFMVLLALVLLLGRALHNRPKLNSYLSEPAMTLIVSVFFSFLIKIIFTVEEYISDDYDGYYEYDDVQQNDYNNYNNYNNGINNYVGVDQTKLSQFLLSFSEGVFFMVFLPPIMFNSGYELKRELFFRHLKPIVSFAVVGTALTGVVTGLILWKVSNLGWTGPVEVNLLEMLAFGSLIAATDTVSVLGVLNAKKVNPHLFSLVFGESALNDAVAIVLFQSFSHLVKMGGIGSRESLIDEVLHFVLKFLLDILGCPIMGIAFSFAAALIFKKVDFHGTPVLELSLYLLIMYIPFIVAEVLGMSGIVTIFFTGIFARRYIEPNVTDETKHNAEVIFNLVAYMAEMCIFINLGLSVFGFAGSFQWPFIGFAFVASLIGRAVSIYPISFLFNCSLVERRERHVSSSHIRRKTIDVVTNNDIASDNKTALSSLQTTTDHDNNNEDFTEKNGYKFYDGRDGNNFFSATGIVGHTPEERLDKVIPAKFMHFLWFAGLRGAVAYACARDFPDIYGHKDEVVATTTVIVFFSVIVMGACCEPLLHKLNIRMGVDNDEYMREWRTRRSLNGRLHTLEKRFVYDVVVRGNQNDIELMEKPFHLDHSESSIHQSGTSERATTTSSSARTLTGSIEIL